MPAYCALVFSVLAPTCAVVPGATTPAGDSSDSSTGVLLPRRTSDGRLRTVALGLSPEGAREAFHSPWMDTATAARYIVASPKTLRQWRCQGRGPRYRAVGGRLIRYHVDDLDAFARGEVPR